MDAFFRLFAPDGTPLMDTVKVDQDAMPWARSPSLVRMGNDGFLVVWRGQGDLWW